MKPAAGRPRAPDSHRVDALWELALPYEAKNGNAPLSETAATAALPST